MKEREKNAENRVSSFPLWARRRGLSGGGGAPWALPAALILSNPNVFHRPLMFSVPIPVDVRRVCAGQAWLTVGPCWPPGGTRWRHERDVHLAALGAATEFGFQNNTLNTAAQGQYAALSGHKRAALSSNCPHAARLLPHAAAAMAHRQLAAALDRGLQRLQLLSSLYKSEPSKSCRAHACSGQPGCLPSRRSYVVITFDSGTPRRALRKHFRPTARAALGLPAP